MVEKQELNLDKGLIVSLCIDDLKGDIYYAVSWDCMVVISELP